jgi:hypothetical protein
MPFCHMDSPFWCVGSTVTECRMFWMALVTCILDIVIHNRRVWGPGNLCGKPGEELNECI